jgi:hypothetical protein
VTNTATTSITLQPRTSTLTFQSNPTGAQLVVGGVTVTTPYVQTIIAGSSLVVNAVSPPASLLALIQDAYLYLWFAMLVSVLSVRGDLFLFSLDSGKWDQLRPGP